MDTKKNNLKKLFDLFSELDVNVSSDSFEEAKEYLESLGIDPEVEMNFGLQQLKKTLFIAEAKKNKEKDSLLLEQASEKIKDIIRKNSEIAGKALLAALGSKKGAYQFRNLENWGDSEIRDVLNDIDLLEFLEELDKETSE